MHTITNKVIKFIMKAIKNWKMELTEGGKTSAEVKIQRDVLTLFLFVKAMMPFDHILTKCTGGYQVTKLQEKINHLIYMDITKLFTKNEKDIGMEFDREKCTMLIMTSRKKDK